MTNHFKCLDKLLEWVMQSTLTEVRFAKEYILPLFSVYLSKYFSNNEPWHEIFNNVVCATSKGSDQPTHTRSLIRAFACPLNFL